MKQWLLVLILLFITVSVNMLKAQKKNKKIAITGYVADADSNPVVGAVILIDKSRTTITTNGKGYYRVRASSDANMITVVSPENQVKSELIGNRRIIDFYLEAAVDSLRAKQLRSESEEMVDLGIMKKRSRNMSQSVNQLDVSGDEYSTYNNIFEMIAGRIPGVDVNGQKIRIRGITSLVADNDPLFVVDGVPMNSINHINPSRVSTISVLKGQAAAIYGYRGTNGVIVINLKKEKDRK